MVALVLTFLRALQVSRAILLASITVDAGIAGFPERTLSTRSFNCYGKYFVWVLRRRKTFDDRGMNLIHAMKNAEGQIR